MIDELIDGLLSSNQILNDEGLRQNDINSLGKHIRNYDDILYNYAKHVDKTLRHKRIMKFWFFLISLSIMFICMLSTAICVVFLCVSIYNGSFDVMDFLTPTVTAIISFLTVYIIIPKIIAKYLFNSKEDKEMKSIIVSIQKYDKYIRNSLHKK